MAHSKNTHPHIQIYAKTFRKIIRIIEISDILLI